MVLWNDQGTVKWSGHGIRRVVLTLGVLPVQRPTMKWGAVRGAGSGYGSVKWSVYREMITAWYLPLRWSAWPIMISVLWDDHSIGHLAKGANGWTTMLWDDHFIRVLWNDQCTIEWSPYLPISKMVWQGQGQQRSTKRDTCRLLR